MDCIVIGLNPFLYKLLQYAVYLPEKKNGETVFCYKLLQYAVYVPDRNAVNLSPRNGLHCHWSDSSDSILS